ncbi:PAS/PAC sensor signal transduction histidine kinase [Clostridium carboxidivorans P7]|uniref:histidine kinase n=1 Tax=Clostridium carboxidivorans P7 TaxID=536227 RepID=C6PWU3_9CLOT|nr:ATP-binding protein [Clostridium carboxidivorans]EET86249.1 PAS/PAC sensor signal transduction histidine kinase [Clostridium carboxidivorans P7]
MLSSDYPCLFSNNSNNNFIVNTDFSNDENMINKIIDNVPIGVIILDSKFNIILWNSALEKMSSIYNKTVIGKNFFQIFPKVFTEDINIKIKNITSTKETIILDNLLVNNFFSSKHYKYCNIKISALENKSSISNGIMLTFEDCTVLQNIRYELNKECSVVKTLIKKIKEDKLHLSKMKEIDKLRTDFFTNISHDLRTPLNIILSALQLMKSFNNLNCNEEKSFKYFKSIKQNSLRLLKLINNLIDITKIDSGYFEIRTGNYNIVNIVEDITLSVAQYVENKSITLTFDTNTEEKFMACDPDKVERIMLNLISNAIKFTNPGGHIFINMFDEDDYIVICVEDTGIGIPEEDLDIIFERFRQSNRASARNYTGSGIGLSLVKSLVEMHGGKISVRSTYGKGTKFVIKLPVTVNETDNAPIQNTSFNKSHIEKVSIEFSDIYTP